MTSTLTCLIRAFPHLPSPPLTVAVAVALPFSLFLRLRGVRPEKSASRLASWNLRGTSTASGVTGVSKSLVASTSLSSLIGLDAG